jgi:hypothetical protein
LQTHILIGVDNMKINKLTPNHNLRWESSRMMLPEHVEALNRHKVDKLKIKKPILDDQEIEEIGQKLGESLEDHSPVNVSYFKSGFIKEMKGIVTKLEPITRQITLINYECDQQNLTFDKVVSVDLL